jgi:anaerobic selenocysteine-containing dehydrogenase
MRTITCLPALVGAWREDGGGVQLSASGAFRRMNGTTLYQPQLSGSQLPRTINMIRLGDALSLDPAYIARAHHHPRPVDPVPPPDQAGPPVKALIVYNSNPLAVCPDQQAVVAGMKREDLFTVVLEHFQTDTADYADYLLPATTQLEHWDLHRSYGHLYVSLNRPAIAPLGQSLPNSGIFRRLAAAMNYDEPCFQESDETILRTLIENQRHATYATVTWEALLRDGYARLNLPQPYLPFAEGNFPTPSRKCEFYSEKMARDGYDPLPNYIRTPSGPAWQDDKEIGRWGDGENTLSPHLPTTQSLICISPPAHSFLNSSFANVDRFRMREKRPLLHIHPQDAEVRQIQSGDAVQVWNQVGAVMLTAEVTEEIVPGTVLAPGIWWMKYSPDGRNINQVVPQHETDMGGGAIFYDVRVWVTLCDPRQFKGKKERSWPVSNLLTLAGAAPAAPAQWPP